MNRILAYLLAVNKLILMIATSSVRSCIIGSSNISKILSIVDQLLSITSNPGGSEYSVSLWLRIVSLQSHTQTVFGCGRRGAYTGTLLRVSGGQNIYAKVIISSKVVATPSYNLGDTLKSWTHVALAAKIGDCKFL